MSRYSGFVDRALGLVAEAVKEVVRETLGPQPELDQFRDPQRVFRWALNNWYDRFDQALRDKYGFDEPTLKEIKNHFHILISVRNAWAHYDPRKESPHWVRWSLLTAAQLLELLEKTEWASELWKREKELVAPKGQAEEPPAQDCLLAEGEDKVAQAIAVLRTAIAAKLGYEPDRDHLGPEAPEYAEVLDYFWRRLEEIHQILNGNTEIFRGSRLYGLFEVLDAYGDLYLARLSAGLDDATWHMTELYEILEKEELIDLWLERVNEFADHEGISLAEAELLMGLFVMRLPVTPQVADLMAANPRVREIDEQLDAIVRLAKGQWPELDEFDLHMKLWKEVPGYKQLLKEKDELWDKEERRLRLPRIQKVLSAPIEDLRKVLRLDKPLRGSFRWYGYDFFDWLRAIEEEG